jgi:thiamine biosynthesis lipoprotein
MLSLAGSAAVFGWAGWQFKASREGLSGLKKVSRQSWALGAEVKLTAYHRDPVFAGQALDKAFAELNRVEDVLSLYRPESEISRLNRHGSLSGAHPWLTEVLGHAEELSRLSEGAFDVTIQPLYRLHGDAAGRGTTPSPTELRKVLARVGWQRVKVSGNRIDLDGPGTEVTLNGIAQGFAADRVGQVLRQNGIFHAFIDTGEVGTVGTKARNQDWKVGIRHPRDKTGLLAIARLQGRCMATSGDYETTFTDGYQAHHLLDPKTGRSPGELASVSVAAPTAMEADGLSTAVFLCGLEKGRRLVEEHPAADALFVTKDGRVVRTEGFPVNS